MWDDDYWTVGYWAEGYWGTEPSSPEPDIYEIIYRTGRRTPALVVNAMRTVGIVAQGERL